MKGGIIHETLALLGSALIFGPPAAQAGNQLFQGSWSVKAFGNEITGGTGESEFYSAFGIPQGIQCNPNQPRCPFESTPTNGFGDFEPLGGSQIKALFCAPWANWGGGGTTARPAKGGTARTGSKALGRRIPPLYRNPAFFTSLGQPGTTGCNPKSRTSSGGKGLVQAGHPVTGKWVAYTTGGWNGGFQFAAAPTTGAAGIRTTGLVGSFRSGYPPIASSFPPAYRYTYATLRNGSGYFGPGKGPGDFMLQYTAKGDPVATIRVKKGVGQFGGTMRMLGALTTKGCNSYYYPNSPCWLGENDWLYNVAGTTASYTSNGVITQGYRAVNTAVYYTTRTYHKRGFSSRILEGRRFRWTTGSVTVKAAGRGGLVQHKTVHYAQGFNARTTISGLGTIQLVSPLLTTWIDAGFAPPDSTFESVGIAILRIKFVPEPKQWVTLVAGFSLLVLGYRVRRR